MSLYNKKEREEIGSLAVKEDVRELLLSRLQMFTKLIVTRNGRSEEVLKKGDIKNIHVQVEDRHAGRKFITKARSAVRRRASIASLRFPFLPLGEASLRRCPCAVWWRVGGGRSSVLLTRR